MDSQVFGTSSSLVDSVVSPLVSPYVNMLDQRNVFSFVGAFTFVFLIIFLLRLLRTRQDFRFGALVRLTFRKSVWLHPSSILDYKLYAVSMVFMTFALGFLVIGSGFWARVAGDVLAALLGPATPTRVSNEAIIVAIAAAQLLALDFGYWLGHLLMHKNRYLWEFHKVHHSAAVLTPATEYRQHPVEFMVVPGMMAVTMGVTQAVITQWLGTGAPALGQFWFNLVILVHVFTIHHLRHSHFNIPFTGLWGRIIHSPGHHRIHHSANPDHFDRNMGYMLSIWDAMAGTLHQPRPNEAVRLGIGAEGALHDSVGASMWLPIRNCWRMLTARQRRAAN